ncbi:uncharacterized protein LOC141637527 isoform X1 [Silene latifolia]|uniref:uncharacterized protein LOC141637527 isoform X1 n=1 Tax=Silene latifolia TaxID=37657 RepID=UPI003D77B37D
MADTSHPKKRQKRSNPKRKFDVGDHVEVKSYEDGFLGSWHPGTVTSCRRGCRVVKYDNLLSDDGVTYFETINVSGLIDGIAYESESIDKCRIRPPPQPSQLTRDDLVYGDCVDSYLNDAWWEGVVFDCDDGSDCRNIFFPDLGDVEKVTLEDLRKTWDWNEFTEEWTLRGKWMFLDLIKKYELENMIPVSIRQIWYDMRLRPEFVQLEDWYISEKIPLWEELIQNVIDEYLRLSVEHFLMTYDFSEPKSIPEANSASFHEIVPSIDNVVQDDEVMALNEVQATVDSEQAMALSVVPSSADLNPVVESTFSKKMKKRRNVTESKSNFTWKPIQDIIDIKPEFYPESVDEYRNSGKPTSDQTKRLRQHVLYLGWKLETTMYGKQRRVRYISPEGYIFYSTRELVPFLKKSEGEDSRRMIVTSPSNLSSREENPEYSVLPLMERNREDEGECYDLSVSSEYFPEAVSKYLDLADWYSRSRSSRELAATLKMHLKDSGWKIRSYGVTDARKNRYRYHSPTSKRTYSSLKLVCQAFTDGIENNVMHPSSSIAKEDGTFSEGHEDRLGKRRIYFKRNHVLRNRRDVERRKHQRKQNGRARSSRFKHESEDRKVADNRLTNGLICSFVSKKRKALSKVKSCPEGHNSSSVLRSSKRVRQTRLPSSSQLPRTVLAWLIENNAVVPRSKVYYYKENSPEPLAEGRITSDGIKCNCCNKVFTLSSFQAHATGYSSRLPTENLFLENDKSLLSCQVELMQKKIRSLSTEPAEKANKKAKGTRTKSWNDHICSICHYGGELLMCDQCPASFHKECLNLEHLPEGDWFCPSCCCGVCGKTLLMTTQQFTNDSVLCCHQCERQYHAGCKKDTEINPGENWFCCRTCEKTHWGLQQLLDKPILVGQDNLTWTLVKPMQYQAENDEDCDLVAMAENFSKISVALEVMHECFEPVKEPRTKRDLVEDVIFCRGSNLNRLNFKGFYTVLLERNDELITVALLRVFGNKVAEIPLIGTRFQHRRLGMCRVVMNEIEKNLLNLGVQKLVLPAAASVLNAWTTSFGFLPITESDRSGFLGYTFLDFQDAIMCQKPLTKLSSIPHLSRAMPGTHRQHLRITDGSNNILHHEQNNSISEVFQEDQREESDLMDQGEQEAETNSSEDKTNDTDNNPEAASVTVTTTVSPNQEGEQPCKPLEHQDRKKLVIHCYKRKKAVEPRPPLPPTTSFSKLQVSCG